MKKLLVIAVLLASFLTQAQNFKFGKVSKEELSETQHPKDAEANAAILFKKQYTRFVYSAGDGFQQETKFHYRIKIYNKEGYDWATKKLKLYDPSNNSKSEKLIGLKGYTFTLVNDKLEKTKLRKENIFDKKSNKYWSTTSFTMPGLAEGCIVEFEYTLKSSFLSIDDVIVQEDIPINTLEIDIITPEYFNYNKLVNPKATFLPEILESKKTRTENINSTSRQYAGGGLPETVSQNSQKLSFMENVVKIYMNEVPALVDEPFTDNIDNYRSKVAFEYAYYKGTNGEFESYSTTWDKVTKTIYRNEDFGGQLEKKSYYKDDIDQILANSSSDIETTAQIFSFIKSKVKWNGFIGYTSEKGVRKAYKEGDGNIADINLMLISMLRYANINANPVLISTRNNGVPLFPTRKGFNYVVCAVQTEEFSMLLDATQSYTLPNILPTNTLNWQGRLIRNDGSSTWVGLSPQEASKEIVMSNATLNEDLTVSGKLRKVLSNYQAFGYRNRYGNKTDETIIQNIESNNTGLTISDYSIKDVANLAKPITQSYGYIYDDSTEKIGESIYLTPLLFLGQVENPFTQNTRNYPIDFVYPISDKYMVSIDIPEGYQVESLPENLALKFDGESASFSYLIKQTGNTLQLVVTLDINKTLIVPTNYEVFKDFYQRMTEKNAEKIVLKKV